METRGRRRYHPHSDRNLMESSGPCVVSGHYHVQTRLQLDRVVSLLGDLNRQQAAFLDQIDEWKLTRRKSIRVIGEIKQKLDSVHTCSEVVQCVGTAAAIIGGILGIAGEFTEDRKRRDDLRNCGKAFGAIGGVGAIAAGSVEFFVSQMLIDEAKLIVEDDQKLLRPILETLQISRDIDSIFEDLFNCSVTSPDFTSIMEAFKIMRSIADAGNYLANSVEGIVESYADGKMTNIESVLQQIGDKAFEKLRIMCTIPSLREGLSKVYDFCNKNRILIEFSKLCLNKVKESLVGRGRSILDEIMMSLSNISGGRMVTASAVRGIFFAVNAAREIITLATKIKDLCDGKTTEYSDLLVKVRGALQHELECLSGMQRMAMRTMPALTYG